MNTIEKLKFIQEQQLKILLEYEQKMFDSIKEIENSVFMRVSHTEDFYDNSHKKTNITITIIGDRKDHEFLNAKNLAQPNNTENQIEAKHSLHFFESQFSLILPKTEVQDNFLKVIKFSKPQFSFSQKTANAQKIIRDLMSTKNSNLFVFPISDFENFADIHEKILNKAATTPAEVQFSNWKIFGKTQNMGFSTPQNFIEKQVLIHNSLIKQLNKFMIDNLQKQATDENMNYMNSKISYLFLDKHLPPEKPKKIHIKV